MRTAYRILMSLSLVILMACATTSRAADSGKRGLLVPLRESEQPGAEVVEEVELYSDSHALVIGIDDYAGGWPRLSNAVRDARAVAAALEANGFSVTLVENLGSDALKRTFEQFFVYRGNDANARLLVWFAGHGYSDGGEGFLVPRDAPLPQTGPAFRLSALSLRRFGEYVRLARSKHAFAIFDSCFSGTIFASARSAPPAAITRVATAPVRQFLTSGDAGQEVSDDGTFRRLFVEALSGARRADFNGDGYLTASELGLFLTDQVTNYSNRRQTPRYGRLNDPAFDRGDFVFKLATTVSVPASAAGAPDRAVTHADKETVFWQSIRDSRNSADFRAYLEQFPSGTFAGLARARLAALSGTDPIHRSREDAYRYDGEWDGWLRTFGGLFNRSVEATFRVTVRNGSAHGTVDMYGETRTFRARILPDGTVAEGRLEGSIQGYDLHGTLEKGFGDGAMMGWKLEYRMTRATR